MSVQKVKVRGQRSRSQRSQHNLIFPDRNSSFNSQMMTEWCRKLEVAWERCPVVFQGHPSNCKVTRLIKEILDFDPNYAFPDCNSCLNSPMAMKLCKKLKVAKKRYPIVLGVICQISRSHGLKNRQFESNFSKITRPVATIKSLGYALFWTAWSQIALH